MNKILLAITLVTGIFFALPAWAATADHLVISQVQITGGPGKTDHDFVEIYNPTAQDINLGEFRLVKRSKNGAYDDSIKSWDTGDIIPARGYYLWANSTFTDIAVLSNATTTAKLANDNGVAIRSGPEDTGVIIDSVAWGEAANAFVEGAVFAENPIAGKALERRPGAGGGNGGDTNNNAEDFFLQPASHPRNTESPAEPPILILPPPPPPGPPPAPSGPPPPPGGGGTAAFLLEFSEILPNPKGNDAGAEWIEIFNAGSSEVDISKWYLDDGAGSDSLPGRRAFRLGDGTKVFSGAYFSINIPRGKISLNNNGDDIRLYDADKNLKLKIQYDDQGREGMSYARNSFGAWEWNETPTPGSVNLFTDSEEQYSDFLRISEIMPNPSGDDLDGEFIEIQNFGQDAADLTGWVVADPRKRYTISEDDFFDTEVPPSGFIVLYREITGINLNNDGDEIKLFDPSGRLVNTVVFGEGQEDMSYARNGDREFKWTIKPTAGAENVVAAGDEPAAKPVTEKKPKIAQAVTTIADEKEFVDLKEVRKTPKDSEIQTRGIVSAPLGIFDEEVFYLSGSGIRVFLEKATGIALHLGDEIELVGQLDSYHSESQLRVADPASLKVLSSENEVSAVPTKTGEINESVEGYLVSIAGTVSRSEGDTFFVDDGSGEARVYIKDSTNIEKPKMRKGDSVKITGIVSQFDENYRLMPRYQSDIVTASTDPSIAGAEVRDAAGLPRTGADFWLMLAVIFFAEVIFLGLILKNSRNLA